MQKWVFNQTMNRCYCYFFCVCFACDVYFIYTLHINENDERVRVKRNNDRERERQMKVNWCKHEGLWGKKRGKKTHTKRYLHIIWLNLRAMQRFIFDMQYSNRIWCNGSKDRTWKISAMVQVKWNHRINTTCFFSGFCCYCRWCVHCVLYFFDSLFFLTNERLLLAVT